MEVSVGRCRTLGDNSSVLAGGVEEACKGAKGQLLLGLAFILRPGTGASGQGLHRIRLPSWQQSWTRVLGPSDPPSLSPADQDGAEPSANSVSAHNLLRLHGFTGHKDWMDKCVCLLTAFFERMRRVPVALPEMVRALSAHQQTLKQVGPLGWDPGWKGSGVAVEAWSGVPGAVPRAQVHEGVALCVCVSPRECL